MHKMFTLVACLILATQIAHAQQQQYTTPVPILKQIDKHNDDGSYTYGYEAADKSFKIETKYSNGEVYGKYGYVDDQGKIREIEYGATKRGFEPAGSDINVPPPTLTNSNPYPLGPNEIDDGQYREDPSVYFKDQKYNRPIAASKFTLNNYQPQPQQQRQSAYNQPQQQPQQQQQYYRPSAPQQYFNAAPTQAPQFSYQPQPTYQQQPYYQPQPQPQQQYQQPQPQYNPYNGNPSHFHPAVKSLDIFSGSYSLDYTGRK